MGLSIGFTGVSGRSICGGQGAFGGGVGRAVVMRASSSGSVMDSKLTRMGTSRSSSGRWMALTISERKASTGWFSPRTCRLAAR